MKQKSFLGLLLSLVMMSSCNNDNDPDCHVGTTYRLSKMTTIDYDNPDNPETIVTEMHYNDKAQLISSSTDGELATFEYDDQGKVTKAKYYGLDKTLEYTSVYHYNGDNLNEIKSHYKSNPESNRSVFYTYDSNKRLIETNSCSSYNCPKGNTESFSYRNNNVAVEINKSHYKPNYTSKFEYTYDNHPSPFTNINKYIRIMMSEARTLSVNNYTSSKSSYFNSNGQWEHSQTETFSMEYNKANYPTKTVVTRSNGKITAEYFYEYIIL